MLTSHSLSLMRWSLLSKNKIQAGVVIESSAYPLPVKPDTRIFPTFAVPGIEIMYIVHTVFLSHWHRPLSTLSPCLKPTCPVFCASMITTSLELPAFSKPFVCPVQFLVLLLRNSLFPQFFISTLLLFFCSTLSCFTCPSPEEQKVLILDFYD